MIKKGKINGKIYDVITPEEYFDHQDYYNNNNNNFTAIEKEGLLYPIRRNNLAPGFFMKNKAMGVYIHPLEEDIDNYRADSIIDFSSAKDMKDIIEKKAEYANMEREILCDADNIFRPVIRETDSAAAKALKEAVISKNIDINKYETRFGPTFTNDKRSLNNSDVTLKKLIATSNALDIKLTMILQDMSDDVPNPMGKVIEVDLTGGLDDYE